MSGPNQGVQRLLHPRTGLPCEIRCGGALPSVDERLARGWHMAPEELPGFPPYPYLPPDNQGAADDEVPAPLVVDPPDESPVIAGETTKIAAHAAACLEILRREARYGGELATVTPAALIERTGLNRDQVSRALARLIENGKAEKVGHGIYRRVV